MIFIFLYFMLQKESENVIKNIRKYHRLNYLLIYHERLYKIALSSLYYSSPSIILLF